MCGIAGLYDRSAAVDAAAREARRSVVTRMLSRLERRGPDGRGIVEDGAVALGHRRLAILDLTPAAAQPMASASGRYVVSYNGEIYNFAEVRDELGVTPGDLRSGSDTEVLLLAWERWGEAALDRLVGQWAFALYDRAERRLWLARDRFGEKPLYLCERGGRVAFASSFAALLEVPWVPRELDPEALVEYVTLRYVIAPRTVVAGVAKLPPGHVLSLGPEGRRLRRWYEPRFRGSAGRRGGRRDEEVAEEFGALLVRASRRCLVSDVPVALLLSEGIDSTSIRYALAEAGRSVESFTYRMSERGEGLAPAEGARPEERRWDLLVTRRGRFDALDAAFASFTEPLGDGAALATWLLIRGARRRATVFLCGHGADEILGGYRLSQDRFRLAAMRRIAWLPPALLRLLVDDKTFGAEPPAARQRRLRRASRRRVPEATRYLIHRPLPAADVGEIVGRPPAGHSYLGTVDHLYATCGERAADLDRIQEVMIHTFLAEDILSFADSVAMDASAELRMPFLDRDLVDFVLTLPPRLRVSPWPGRANTKQILRRWGRRHLPPEVAARRKWNFNYGTVRELLAEDRRGVLDRVLGARAVRRSLPGLARWLERPRESFRGPWEGTLWALLCLGVWSDALGLRPAAPPDATPMDASGIAAS